MRERENEGEMSMKGQKGVKSHGEVKSDREEWKSSGTQEVEGVTEPHAVMNTLTLL